MSVELDFDTGPALPGRVIALGAIALFVGLAFGYAAASTVFTNQLDSGRLEDAKASHDALQKRVAAFEEIRDGLLKLSPDQPDFAAVKKFADAEIAVAGASIGGRTLFDAVAIDNITTYSADSQMLSSALKEHDRLTNKVDKDELEKLAAENEVMQHQYFGVLFDFRHALKKGGDENYVPKRGRLVISHGKAEGDEPGKVSIEVPLSGKKQDIEIQGFIPIEKSQILKTSGGNALTRYNYRVRQLKFRTVQLAKQSDTMLQSLKRIYEDEDAAPAAPAAPEAPAEPAGEAAE